MNLPSAIRKSLAIASLVVSVATILLLTFYQLQKTQMLTQDRVRLDRYVEGTAAKPFARRVLVPITIRTVVAATPTRLALQIERSMEPLNKWLLPGDGATTLRPLYYYVLTGILIVSLSGYAWISHVTYRRLYGPSSFGLLVSPLALVILIPFVSFGFGHIYDFSVLLFMSALLLAMTAERHKLFLVIFAVSCLNKETTILATVAYACYFIDRLPQARFYASIGIQLAVFVVIQVVLRRAFAANIGADMEFWWGSQISWLMSRSFAEFAGFGFFAMLVAFGWRAKSLVLRRSMVQLVPHAGLIFIGNYPGEMRALYDSLPILVLMACRTLEWVPYGGIIPGQRTTGTEV